MSELAAACCSIAATQRKKWFWAAWWSGPPTERPFRKPDAANGGHASMEEALREAEKTAGRTLVLIEPSWAKAWTRVLRGQPPFAAKRERVAAPSEKPAQPLSAWQTLGLEPGSAHDEIKKAYRQRALETHPDRGGEASAFRAVQKAFEKLSGEPKKPRPRRR